jgi:hypothetical protein
MKLRLCQQRHAAMTLFEVGIVVAVVLILAMFFLSRTANNFSPETLCMNNQKQIGLGFKLWAGDNNDTLPMGVAVTNGGCLELAATGNVLSIFLVMSNELATPRILRCPTDAGRLAANDFIGITCSNLSYFASVDATNDANPQMIISGDADVLLGGKKLASGLNLLQASDPLAWGSRHPKTENIGLNDGSVQSVNASGFRSQLKLTGYATNRFALP